MRCRLSGCLVDKLQERFGGDELFGLTLLMELLDGVAAVIDEGLEWTSAGVATTTGAALIAAMSSSDRLELLTGTSW